MEEDVRNFEGEEDLLKEYNKHIGKIVDDYHKECNRIKELWFDILVKQNDVFFKGMKDDEDEEIERSLRELEKKKSEIRKLALRNANALLKQTEERTIEWTLLRMFHNYKNKKEN